MKKRKIAFAMALGMWLCGMSQVLTVTGVERVDAPRGMAVAAISPQGDYLLLTSGSNQGLTKMDLATRQTQVLSTASSAGHDVKISPDGQTVVFREGSLNKKRLRVSSLQSVNVASGTKQQVVKPTRDLQGYAASNSTVGVVNKGKWSKKALGKAKAEKVPVLSIDKGELMLTLNGKTRQLSPNGKGKRYLWASLSPDGKRVLYYVAANGAWVCNLDGSNARKVGTMRAPVWYDNNTVVGMMDQDDGEMVFASTLVAATLDGATQTLTGDDVIAMYPHTCEGKIAFSTPGGEVYVMSVTK